MDPWLHAIIFRGDPAPGQASDSITHETATPVQRVDFDGVLMGVDQWNYGLKRFRPNIPDPNAEAPLKPDTGLNTLMITLNCTVRNYDIGADPDERDAHPVERLKRWLVRPQVVPGRYDEGRIGLWFWNDRMLNHAPVRNGGYKLVDVDVRGDAQRASVRAVDVILEYSGKILLHGSLGADIV